MYLHSLATAVPDRKFTQQDCWEILRDSELTRGLSRRSQLTLQALLRGDTGIDARSFALPDIESVWRKSGDELNEAFRQTAPRLAGQALNSALAQGGIEAKELDALLICTCTGYLCPGLTSYVSERLGLRTDIWLQDLVGLGCGAAIPMLRSAQAILALKPDAIVACVAVEVCSAAFCLDDDPGVLVSACLFGDGAAATIWRSEPGERTPRCRDFATSHRPAHRNDIRFEMRGGRLRNLLRPTVPDLAADAVRDLLGQEHHRGDRPPIGRVIAHGGGKDVLAAIEAACPDYVLSDSRAILRRHGNMSSPSVLFALQEALGHATPDAREDWWLVSFGAGFSIHACRFGL